MINNLHSTCTIDTQIGTQNAQDLEAKPSRQPRVLVWDALRVVGMLAVIGIHSLMTSRGVGAPPQMAALDKTLHFAVPLLVFISGALVWGPRASAKPQSATTFFKKRAQRVGLPYLAWFSLYAVLLFSGIPYSGALQPSGEPSLTILNLLGYLGSGHIWYHLYFIPMILTFYLATPLVVRVMPKLRWGPEFSVLLALGLRVYGWPPLLEYVGTLNNPYLFSYLTHVFVHLPHMALGCWFAYRWGSWLKTQSNDNESLIKAFSAAPWWSVINLGAAVFLLGLLSGPSWMGALTHFGRIGVLLLSAIILIPLWRRYQSALSKISSLTFGAYFIHPLGLILAQTAFPPAGHTQLWTSWWFVALVFTFLLISSFGGAYLLSLSKRTNWLIGE